MTLAIIIPMLNESAVLPELMERLRPLTRSGAEIIFVDGGSRDDSAVMAERGGFRVIRASGGRAVQMNAGAAVARGTILLFLHADTLLPDTRLPDTRLPDGVMRILESAMSEGEHVWGRFDVNISGKSPLLHLVSAMVNLRSRWSGIATGDQAIFVKRSVFERIGGFPEQPLMEDIEFSRRLLHYSRPACLREKVMTSGRRWERYGVWRTIFLMWRLRWAYWRGVPAEILVRRYQ